jgi:hypothetical protein
VGRSPLGAGLITAGLFGLTWVAAVHTGVGRELDQSALLAKSAVIEISPIAVEIVDIVPVAAVALVLGIDPTGHTPTACGRRKFAPGDSSKQPGEWRCRSRSGGCSRPGCRGPRPKSFR